MSDAAQKRLTPPPPPGTSVPPLPATAEQHYRLLETRRRALLMELNEIDDQLVAAQRLRARTIPRRTR